ncbi:MAG TPA: hypothetical protein VLK85_29630 [Ramlibacter sp.]|nr:hypothetical protein [Ramlibacter sp.]
MDGLIIAGLVLVLLVIAAVLLMRRRQTEHLRRHFGPEYERAVEEHGSPAKAEAELLARQKRVKKLHLVPLQPEQAARFADAWRGLQGRFVDNPHGVLTEADRLVCDLMQQRGYPMGDFDSCAADISVDHPAVVHHYRSARDIALRDARGEADTEAVRQAVVHYRALFSELLEVAEPHPEPEPRPGLLARKRDEIRDKHHMETHS